MTKKRKPPVNKLNDLTAKEWIVETISVWNQKGLGRNHPDTKIEKEHPAPFSFTDVSRLIKFFSKEGGVILDPFVGIGSTLKACVLTKRKGVGIELNGKYVELTEKRLKNELKDSSDNSRQQIIHGDANKELDKIKNDSIDFIVTSPPYWNILNKKDHKAKQERINKGRDTKYSDDKKDLGNIDSYSEFLDKLIQIFVKCSKVLKRDAYMAVIVSDFREKSRYIMFHSDLANKLEEVGYVLKGITVLYQRHKRIFPYGYPYSYVPNIHNQYILIVQNKKNEEK
tara:strand:+ start:716 stop:1564 length:849 start_codon:yes stop_codon:yes gene_type:complete